MKQKYKVSKYYKIHGSTLDFIGNFLEYLSVDLKVKEPEIFEKSGILPYLISISWSLKDYEIEELEE